MQQQKQRRVQQRRQWRRRLRQQQLRPVPLPAGLSQRLVLSFRHCDASLLTKCISPPRHQSTCLSISFAAHCPPPACLVACSNGRATRALTDIGSPALDWVSLAVGMGVPATRATTCDELAAQLAAALERNGPSLIEAVL